MKTPSWLVLLLLTLLAASPAWAQQEGSGKGEGSGKMEGSGSAAHSEAALVLKGYDPVLLVQGKKEKGDPSLAVRHAGFEYHFASAANKAAFEASPEKYAVQVSGNCPVLKARTGEESRGEPDLFAVHAGKIYLFSSADARAAFEKNPDQFVAAGRKEGSHH